MKSNDTEERNSPGDLILFLDENSYARLEIGLIIVETSVPSMFQILAPDGPRTTSSVWFHISL